MITKWDNTFIEIAKLISKHSTCSRVHVGTIIVKDRRIISMGYNGVASGKMHCDEKFMSMFLAHVGIKTKMGSNKSAYLFNSPGLVPQKFQDKEYEEKELHQMYEDWKTFDYYKISHRKFSIENELHGEINAIIYAGKNGISVKDTTLYCTVSPCMNCAKTIVASEIKRVVYLEKYDRDDDNGIKLLEDSNIEVEQII